MTIDDTTLLNSNLNVVGSAILSNTINVQYLATMENDLDVIGNIDTNTITFDTTITGPSYKV